MNYRSLGRTGWRVSEISFGAWAIGGAWGKVDDEESIATLHAALDGGVNFFDTADVYGDGRSERLLAKLKRERKEEFYIATKAGRRLPVQTTEGYSRKNLTAFVNRSLKTTARSNRWCIITGNLALATVGFQSRAVLQPNQCGSGANLRMLWPLRSCATTGRKRSPDLNPTTRDRLRT